MKESLKVAAIQMVTGTSLADNLNAAAQLIDQAAGEGSRLIALPEYFCLLGQNETDKLHIAENPGEGPIQTFLSETARRHGIWLAGGSIPLISAVEGKVLNTQLIFNPEGRQIARYDKIHLFGFSRGTESYDESRGIVAGSTVQRIDTPVADIGLSICYDLRFPELYRALGQVDLILVPSAFTYTTGQSHWEVLLRARAIENQCYVLAPAQGGVHANGRRTWGHSMLIDPWGDVLAVLDEQQGVVSGTIDPIKLNEVRQALPALKHRVL